ncbi:hypothetical protein BU17DRAFT_91861 [Hysterangium stoloniferum]|nr:hypothetical protein BU17DRAFT_91861 [Hysterangium stoloniferum]
MIPRPRPRPRMAAPAASALHGSETSGSSAANAVKQLSENRDDFFVRNKGRSIKEINQRVAQAVAAAQISSSETGSEDSESDVVNEITPKGNRRSGKQSLYGAGRPHAMPKWTKKGGIRTLLTVSDEEGNGSGSSNDDLRGSGDGTAAGKCVRPRSRSRSLTPPPELTETERLRTQLAIQKVLQNEHEELLPRRNSPPIEIDDADEDDEGENLDPVLRRIEQRVRNRQNDDGQVCVANSIMGTAIVIVRVTWVPHPEDDMTRDRSIQGWTFSIGRNESLKVLSSQISDRARILTKDLVLMRERKQLFTSITPHGLQVWDKVDLEACTRTTYEALQMRHARSPTPAQGVADAPNYDREGSPNLSEASAGADNTDMKFKIVLRASGKNNITLTVRPSTTCGKIIRAYLTILIKQGGTALSPRKSSQVRLCVDGEKQHPDTPISDCDLEDGDMVEVVGL